MRRWFVPLLLLALGTCTSVAAWQFKEYRALRAEFYGALRDGRAAVPIEAPEGVDAAYRVAPVLRRAFSSFRLGYEILGSASGHFVNLPGGAVGHRLDLIEEDSPFRHLGALPGDVVLSLAGVPCATREDVREALGRVGPGATVDAVILREGHRRTHRYLFEAD